MSTDIGPETGSGPDSGTGTGISPYTGWTRETFTALADRMLLAAHRHASPSHSLITPPGAPGGYGTAVDGLEGFARTFLLAGFRVAGEQRLRSAEPAGLVRARVWRPVPTPPRRSAGSRRRNTRQAKVEAASIALILDLTRPWLWDRLDERVREQVVAYLSQVVGDPDYPRTNWVWFRIVVEQFLRLGRRARGRGRTWSPIWRRTSRSSATAAGTATARNAATTTTAAGRCTCIRCCGAGCRARPDARGAAAARLPGASRPLPARRAAPGRRRRIAADPGTQPDLPVRRRGAVLGRRARRQLPSPTPDSCAAPPPGSSSTSPSTARRTRTGCSRSAGTVRGGGWPSATPGRARRTGPRKGLLGLALPADHPVWTSTEQAAAGRAGRPARRPRRSRLGGERHPRRRRRPRPQPRHRPRPARRPRPATRRCTRGSATRPRPRRCCPRRAGTRRWTSRSSCSTPRAGPRTAPDSGRSPCRSQRPATPRCSPRGPAATGSIPTGPFPTTAPDGPA